MTWAKVKSVALHALTVFTTVALTNLAALSATHSYSAAKAVVVSAIASAGVAVLHYLQGFVPNVAATAAKPE